MRRSRALFFLVFILCVMSAGSASLYAAQTQDQLKDLALHYYRGVVNFEAKQYEASLAEFQAVATIDPYYKDVQQYMEKCVRVLEENLNGLDKMNAGAGRKDVDLYFLGKSYYEKGDYKRALEAFNAVLSKDPNDKFALYYAKLCKSMLPRAYDVKKARLSPEETRAANAGELEKEVSYVKSDIKEKEDVALFLEKKAQRKADRDELIRKKEGQLKEQVELLEEERQDYLAEEKITKRTQKLQKEVAKWRDMKERLASDQPGIPTDFIDYPVIINKADAYYASMKDALRQSRWNSAGLNAINASIYYCDALLIYFYGVKSAEPKHENIGRLLIDNVRRADMQQALFHLNAILNLKKLIETEDRPITRNEAIFLGDHADKVAEWCKAILPT